MARTKLTDKKRKKIIADYTEIGSYNEVARINGVARNTVKNVVLKNKDVAKMCQAKKEENTKDILQYMDNIVEKQKKIIDLSLDVLEEKLSNPDFFTNIRDVAIVYGTIFDKSLKYKEMKLREMEIEQKKKENSTDKINANILNIANLLNNPMPNRSEKDVQ